MTDTERLDWLINRFSAYDLHMDGTARFRLPGTIGRAATVREAIDKEMSLYLRTPWTADVVERLKRYQADRQFHPYTCGRDSAHRPLVPMTDGWHCLDCDYRQTWAHASAAALCDTKHYPGS